MSFRLFPAAVALLVAAGIASAQTPLPPSGTARGESARILDEHLGRAERFGFAGVVVVAKDGEVILHKAYGLADREAGKRVTTETLFDIGSITKPFTASAVLKLADERKLRVHDPITRFIDNVPADKRSITIHHLLTHTSGLANGFGGDYDLISRDSLVRVMLASPLENPPGSKYEYSNAGYSLLGAIMEKASGLPYERYLRDRVLLPAGAASTGYKLVDWTRKPVAVGYRGSGRLGTPLEQRWADDGPSWHLRANGGLLSTAGDLYRWVAAFHGNRILSAASYKKATTPPTGFEYGYGWEVSRLPNGKRFITHNGSNGYFYARVAYIPDDKMAIAFTTNDGANRRIENDIVNILSGESAPEIPRVEASNVSLAQYGGRYRTSAGTQFDLRPTVEGLELSRAPAPIVASLILNRPDPSPQRSDVDSAIVRTVGGMAAGNYSPYRDHFWPVRDYRIDGEVEFWTEVFKDWRESYGEYLGAEILGSAESNDSDGRQTITYVGLKYSKGDRVLRTMQPSPATGKFFVATVSPAQWPTRYLLVPRSTTEFLTYNLELRRVTSMKVELDDAGRVRGIIMPSGLRAEKVGEL